MSKNIALLLLPALLLLASCDETDYMRFDTSSSGVYFTDDSLSYSFGVTPIEERTHLFEIPVRVMGSVADYDRTIAYEIIPDLTKAESGVHFNIVSAFIPAGEVEGYINVELLRDNLEGTHIDGYTRYRLVLQLAENENFVPTLSAQDCVHLLKFDNSVEQPNWLNPSGEKIWSVGELGTWHPLTFIKLVEYFHKLEDILPETYYKIVEDYGENLEHIPFGDVYLYRTVFNKYIFSPMYEYFNNPANRDAILAEYPDYPFNFPKPF